MLPPLVICHALRGRPFISLSILVPTILKWLERGVVAAADFAGTQTLTSQEFQAAIFSPFSSQCLEANQALPRRLAFINRHLSKERLHVVDSLQGPFHAQAQFLLIKTIANLLNSRSAAK